MVARSGVEDRAGRGTLIITKPGASGEGLGPTLIDHGLMF